MKITISQKFQIKNLIIKYDILYCDFYSCSWPNKSQKIVKTIILLYQQNNFKFGLGLLG